MMNPRPRQLVVIAVLASLAVCTTACQQNKSQSTSTSSESSRSDAGAGAGAGTADAGAKYFSNWPRGKSPGAVGDLVAARFIVTPHRAATRQATTRASEAGGPSTRRASRDHIIYPEVCTWYGALTFAKVTDDDRLRQQLIKRFEPLFGPQKRLIPPPDHVDNTVFAAVPFELYMQTKDPRYLELGRKLADAQWGEPFGRAATQPAAREWADKGYTWQTRMWIDDMYMITAAQAQAYRATGERKYIDRAAKEMVLYLDELQQPNGLFYHAPDAKYFWGRGDGWMAAGMAELLRSLPQDHPDRPRIMKGYKTMMASLLKYQDENGMWHQLIDDPASWPETSSTAMFTFAFITGVKNGWLDADTYGPAARKGWLALTRYLEPNGDIREVCQGTNKYNPQDPSHGPDGRAYYLARKRITGDLHGQAPMLWCATALLREPERGEVAAR